MSKLVRIMWLPVLVSMLYAGYIVYQRRAAESGPPSVERDPMAAYGNSVKILQFYTGNPEIAHGGKALLCYGVVNAAAVRLDPPVESMWPSTSRCFEVTPTSTTRYTLTAEAKDKTTATESIEVKVHP